jgi:hypothetical protein
MSFDLSALSAYTEQNAQQLVIESVIGAKTAQMIKEQGNVLVNVKSAETINRMTTDLTIQADACGWNSASTTAFSQRTLQVGKMKVNESLCLKDLEAYYLQKALPAGSHYDSMVFAEQYTKLKTEKIAEKLEQWIWGGAVGSNGALFNGFKYIIEDDVLGNNANTTAITTLTTANIIAVVDSIYSSLPAKVLGKNDVKIFCSMDTFRKYQIALKNANLFHYANDSKADASMFIPATNIELVAVQGFDYATTITGADKIKFIASPVSNMFLGTDLLDEQAKFDLFYAKEANEMRFLAEFKLGVNFAFGDEITYWALA